MKIHQHILFSAMNSSQKRKKRALESAKFWRTRVIEHLTAVGYGGSTPREIAVAFGQPVSDMEARIRELCSMGRIMRTDRVRDTADGLTYPIYVASFRTNGKREAPMDGLLVTDEYLTKKKAEKKLAQLFVKSVNVKKDEHGYAHIRLSQEKVYEIEQLALAANLLEEV